MKVCLRAPEGKKTEFLQSTAIFSISLGQRVLMQGKCLQDSLRLIEKTFRSCDIVISDFLQRFNLRIENPNLSEKEAEIRSLTLGKDWINRHHYLLESLSIPSKIYHWKDWLSHEKYAEKIQFLNDLYHSDFAFQKTIFQAGEKYFQRRKQPLSLHSIEYELTLKFILEEAAIMLLWCEHPYDFELHPSPRSEALVYVHQLYFDQTRRPLTLKQARIKILGNSHDEKSAKSSLFEPI